MMDHMEMVEKLREKAQVSYEEAKAALEQTNWDMLDAIILLEKQGRAGGPAVAQVNTQPQPEPAPTPAAAETASFSEMLGRFFRWVGRVIQKGNQNHLDVRKDAETIMSIPLTVLVLLLIFTFWFTIPLMVIGLFCGYHYSFRGPEIGRDDLNSVMDKAAGAVDNMKQDFKQGMDNSHHS